MEGIYRDTSGTCADSVDNVCIYIYIYICIISIYDEYMMNMCIYIYLYIAIYKLYIYIHCVYIMYSTAHLSSLGSPSLISTFRPVSTSFVPPSSHTKSKNMESSVDSSTKALASSRCNLFPSEHPSRVVAEMELS